MNSPHGRVTVCAWLTPTNTNSTIKLTELFNPVSNQLSLRMQDRSFHSFPLSWHRFNSSRKAGLPWESRCVPMSLKGCLNSVVRSVVSMCRGHTSCGALKRVSEPSRHPVSPLASFYLQLLAADWLMTSCITLNHSFSVSAASRTSWLDTQECDAPGFICIKGRVPRKGDETGIDLEGEPDGQDRRNRDRRRHATQTWSWKQWCLMFPRRTATLVLKSNI